MNCMNQELFQFLDPNKRLPSGVLTSADSDLHDLMVQALRCATTDLDAIQRAFAGSSFPKDVNRLVLVMYAPGSRRILITRPVQPGLNEFGDIFDRLMQHPRREELAAKAFRLQIDFVTQEPTSVDFYLIGMEVSGLNHIEIGIDGLLFRGIDKKLNVFLPGDAYVRSIMGMGQLREYLDRIYGIDYIKSARFQRFKSVSFVSSSSNWCSLYRGHPIIGELNRPKIEGALQLAIEHIKLTQQEDGKFLYYYDSATDSRRDHEHPKRDPEKNPYYNILRHCGGAVTCLFHERLNQRGDTLSNVRRAIDYLVAQARVHEYAGETGAYIYSEKKSKLGGSGLALYLLAQFERISGDSCYRPWADRLACHLLNQITENGEFIYYNIYLEKVITEVENKNYFSFFYPGEAICGLAAYLHLLTPSQRPLVFEKVRLALAFLLEIRPITRASEYSNVPSDGWLMMGIMELWDFAEMQIEAYADFVFSDAQKMIDHMYKVTDAPYPDYAGSFYYKFGEYPYDDGARCEGLLGAFELAVKMGRHEQARALWQAMQLASWALLHLVNTPESVYFAPNPKIAVGGIRFKHTRQWFRIDTIQHVASFFAKLLPYWDEWNQPHS